MQGKMQILYIVTFTEIKFNEQNLNGFLVFFRRSCNTLYLLHWQSGIPQDLLQHNYNVALGIFPLKVNILVC